MASYTNAQSALWLILSDLESLDNSSLKVPLIIDFIFKPYPDYRQVACELAVQVCGYDESEIETHLSTGMEPLRAWAEKAPATGLRILREWMEAEQGEDKRNKIINWIGKYAALEVDEPREWTLFRRKSCAKVLLQGLRSDITHGDNIETVLALAKCDYPLDLTAILNSEAWSVGSKHELVLLGWLGHAEHWPRFLESWVDSGTRYGRTLEKQSLRLFERVGADQSVLEQIILNLENWERSQYARFRHKEIIRIIAYANYELYEKTILRFAISEDWGLRRLAAWAMGDFWNSNPVQRLTHFLKETDSDVIEVACDSLLKIDNLKTCRLAMEKLNADNWRVRHWAVRALTNWYNPALLDHLLPLTKDGDSDVREAALKAVSIYRDRRVLAEILVAATDPHREVQYAAEFILKLGTTSSPAMDLHPEYSEEDEWWVPTLKKMMGILSWGQKTGKELLRKPVKIKTYRQGLGRTPNTNKSREIFIEASVTPFLSGHRHGADILRAIILHELGHHLYDIGEPGQKTMEGIAGSEGLQQIFAILIDERLERKMRSRQASWGVYFDRLAAYAFAQDEDQIPVSSLARLLSQSSEQIVSDIQAGRLPGRLSGELGLTGARMVTLSPLEQMALPGLMMPLGVFLICLRCRFDLEKCPLPDVVTAIEAVPNNLKSLDHAGVLEVARVIGAILGRDEVHKKHQDRLRQAVANTRGSLENLLRILNQNRQLGMGPEAGQPNRSEPFNQLGPVFEMDAQNENPIARPAAKSSGKAQTSRKIILSEDAQLQFPELNKEKTLQYHEQRHLELIKPLNRHIRLLRPFLEKLGQDTVIEGGLRKGRRLDVTGLSGALVRNSPNVFRREMTIAHANCYIGILIDCSSSMAGEGIARARAFAALLAESAKFTGGVVGHVNAFDDDTFYYLGDFRRNTIASLSTGGGNNDSGALSRATEMAQASGRKNRMLIMISDGQPSACTFESLEHLVGQLSNHLGIVCAQVAVDSLPRIAFPNYVDLSDYEFHEAVSRFGRLLINLTNHWR